MKRLYLLLIFLSFSFSLGLSQTIRVGADRIREIAALTEGKRVGITGNQTTILTDSVHTHLLDTLLRSGVHVTCLYSPEHGFRGDADAGASVKSGHDSRSGLPIISLYGKNKKPSKQQLAEIDVMLFDLQDVGVRFYTYISTLKYVLEACAEAGIPVIVLDRPNPHDTIDGPVLKDKRYKSFISLLPIPAVHGMTMGEIAMMIKGEEWIDSSNDLDLNVLRVEGWKHGTPYDLPVPPSPNLKSPTAILMYPTLCYFEASTWSVGRGTDGPFEQIGYPDHRLGAHIFTPVSMKGASSPKHKGKVCHGPELKAECFTKGINLGILIDAARQSKKYGIRFIDRPGTFNLLAGNGDLKQQIESGWTEEQIRESWTQDLCEFKKIRQKYLLYPDDRQ